MYLSFNAGHNGDVLLLHSKMKQLNGVCNQGLNIAWCLINTAFAYQRS
ncbi:hypothetical protein D018_1835 [Vibrio parahaemolyticus VP2007-007]|nr:hypothetical protein D018_1835 [Vibrio parahaemolyticus VP2007-007]